MTATKEPTQSKAIVYTGSIQENFIGHIMAEIFKDRVYAPYLEGRKDLTILDIGAHIGIFSIYASPYAKHIYAMEPSMEHFTSLTQNIASNQLDNVTPFCMAMSNENGTATFHHNRNKTMYSLKGAVGDKSLGTETVETVTIEKFLNDNDIKHVNFMKLDVEGAEFEILGGDAFARVADRIDTIVTEAHTWADRHPNQLLESLKNNGYTVSKVQADADLIVARR